ncbi:MAG TPA: glutamyl-tRNA reductase [Sphingobacteriaceae bacterium]|nr:glutamyl-tRNA reductase [Sphingobacteriaceae bacterium]
MTLLVLGLNHRTAPVAVRERFAWTGAQAAEARNALARLDGVRESAWLGTCNRSEIYAVVDPYHVGLESILDFLSRWGDMPLSELRPLLYSYRDHEAARHLFRVACGLDAMVVGEGEILGQVRQAYTQAQTAGTVDKLLHQLFSEALRVGKRARTETAIGQHALSVSGVAVQWAKDLFPDLENRVVMIVGAGETAEGVLRSLQAAGARAVVVANRTAGRALALAEEYGGRAIGLDELPAYIPAADIIISSTSSRGWILTRDMLARALQASGRWGEGPDPAGKGGLYIIDLAVPRDVDPAAAQLPGVRLVDIDQISVAVNGNLRARQLEIPQVEAIIQDEVKHFGHWLSTQEVVPVIRSLRTMAYEIREAELRRIFNKIPDLDERQRQIIETATAAMINKVLSHPTALLREWAGQDEGRWYAKAVSELFNLPAGDQEPPQAPKVG